jgi:hypothetical protein
VSHMPQRIHNGVFSVKRDHHRWLRSAPSFLVTVHAFPALE